MGVEVRIPSRASCRRQSTRPLTGTPQPLACRRSQEQIRLGPCTRCRVGGGTPPRGRTGWGVHLAVAPTPCGPGPRACPLLASVFSFSQQRCHEAASDAEWGRALSPRGCPQGRARLGSGAWGCRRSCSLLPGLRVRARACLQAAGWRVGRAPGAGVSVRAQEGGESRVGACLGLALSLAQGLGNSLAQLRRPPAQQSRAGRDCVFSDLIVGLRFPETQGKGAGLPPGPQPDPKAGQEAAGKRSNSQGGLSYLLPRQDVVLGKQLREESLLWL